MVAPASGGWLVVVRDTARDPMLWFRSPLSLGTPKSICRCQAWAALHRIALDSSGWLRRAD
jgi:hypothetical protein